MSHTDKRWRHALGKRAEDTCGDLLRELLLAKNAPKSLKGGYLVRAAAQHELLLLTLRLMLELKTGNETMLFQAQEKLLEVGRMLGGWLKSSQP